MNAKMTWNKNGYEVRGELNEAGELTITEETSVWGSDSYLQFSELISEEAIRALPAPTAAQRIALARMALRLPGSGPSVGVGPKIWADLSAKAAAELAGTAKPFLN